VLVGNWNDLGMNEVPFSFRPLTRADLGLLYEWRNRPHVADWWGGPASLKEIERDKGADIDSDVVQPFIALLGETPVGFIQSYRVMGAGDGWWPNETDPGARGIDLFLADPSTTGRGLGSRMAGSFVARLFGDPAVTKIQADPAPTNARAIRAFEKAGFRRVGLVQTPDGELLLMIVSRSAATVKGP
jgi:RimJ/RimL family protein N-acetyltransferase